MFERARISEGMDETRRLLVAAAATTEAAEAACIAHDLMRISAGEWIESGNSRNKTEHKHQ